MPLIAWVYVFSFPALAAGLIAGAAGAVLATGALAALAALLAVPTAPSLVAIGTAAAVIGATTPKTPRYAALPAGTRGPIGTVLAAQRARASESVERVFGKDAPVARALLLADQSRIPRETKRRYADAGIVHMLSISGLHVSIIAAALGLGLRACRLTPRVAAVATVALTGWYVAIIGFPAPAVRSAVMLGALTLAHAAQRHTSPWAVLGLGAIAPLASPETALDLGYQLSVAGMAALLAARGVGRRVGWPGGRRAGRVGQALLTSVLATLVTAPIVAAAFGRLSVIAPLTNLVADPVIAVAQPMLFLALVLSPVPPLARLVADGVHPLLVAFDRIAAVAAAVPGGAIDVRVGVPATVLFCASAAALVVACASRFPGRAAVASAGTLAAAVWMA